MMLSALAATVVLDSARPCRLFFRQQSPDEWSGQN